MAIDVEIVSTSVTVEIDESPNSVVIEATRGLPGLQNVVISETEPEFPFENMVWIDISGG